MIMKKTLLILIVASISVNICKSQIFNSNNNIVKDNNVLYLTSLFTAVNLYQTVNNLSKLTDTNTPKQNAVFGIATGGLQILYTFTYPLNDSYDNKELKSYKLFNIGMGSITIISSVMRLAFKQPTKTKSYSWNIIYIPVKNNNPCIGLRIIKKINI